MGEAIAGRPFAAIDEWDDDWRKWARGWRSLTFPAFFLLYLGQVVHGVSVYSSGWLAAIGVLAVVAFGVAYLAAINARSHELHGRLWMLFGTMVALLVVEVPIARNDAFVMCVFIGVLAVSALGPRAIGLIVLMAVSAAVVPALVPSWDTAVDVDMGITIVLVSLAMFAFFGLMQANRELSSARSEVARLAAESERSRIARDLHDLLGHSLTTGRTWRCSTSRCPASTG